MAQGMSMFFDFAAVVQLLVTKSSSSGPPAPHSLVVLANRLWRKSPVLPVTEVGVPDTSEHELEGDIRLGLGNGAAAAGAGGGKLFNISL